MAGRHPEYVLEEEVHAIDAEAHEAVEQALVVPSQTREHRPVVLGPHVGLELPGEGPQLVRAGLGRSHGFLIDPVHPVHVEVVARVGPQDYAQHVAPKDVQQQLNQMRATQVLHGPTSTPKSWAASVGRRSRGARRRRC